MKKLLTGFSAFVIVAAFTVSQATAQAPAACTEDFSSDTDPTQSGFAGSVFVHGVTTRWQFGGNFPIDPAGHTLWLFAGATDPITFPGQAVTSARVRIFAYGTTFVTFQGTGDTLTRQFNPGPFLQIAQATSATLGDNGQPLGQINRILLQGFETQFDDVEISPCGVAPPPTTSVDVLVRPNSINPKRNHGVMKAVILTDSVFDASIVDPQTVQFGSATVPFRYFLGDEDEDGDIDLIFFFLVDDVGIECGDTTIPLTGLTNSGQSIEGEGEISTVGCP
jgi:hypothetical protein